MIVKWKLINIELSLDELTEVYASTDDKKITKWFESFIKKHNLHKDELIARDERIKAALKNEVVEELKNEDDMKKRILDSIG